MFVIPDAFTGDTVESKTLITGNDIKLLHNTGMTDYFISDVTEVELAREKAKARELRASQWWKRKLAEGRCHYCHGQFKPSELTMDHIVPIIRGGKSAKGNVVPCCKECNNKKKHMLPMEWQEYLAGIE